MDNLITDVKTLASGIDPLKWLGRFPMENRRIENRGRNGPESKGSNGHRGRVSRRGPQLPPGPFFLVLTASIRRKPSFSCPRVIERIMRRSLGSPGTDHFEAPRFRVEG